MSDSMSIKVDGLADLEAQLLELGSAGAKRSVRKGLRAMSNVVRDEARRRAPVETGLLQKSIRTADTGITATGWSFAVDVRDQAFYGRFLEYGTSKMAARPFMRPAAESAAAPAVEAFQEVTAAAIEAEWDKRS